MKRILLILALIFTPILGFSQIQPTGFTDVEIIHPNVTAIGFVKAKEIMNGYANAEFRPNSFINRAEMMKIVVLNLYDLNTTKACDVNDVNFTDIVTTEWFTNYVCMGVRENLISGFEDGTFRPAENVTVAQSLKFVALMIGMPQDSSGSPWYMPYAQFLVEKNILPKDLPQLDSPVNRAHVAEMIWRAHLSETAAATVDNEQEENEFWADNSLTLEELLSGQRIAAKEIFPEPVAHMNPIDVYFEEKLEANVVEELLQIINEERAAVAGAQPLKVNARLSWAAQVHTDRMLTYDFFAHTTPGGDNLRTRVKLSGFKAVFYGENLVRGAIEPIDALRKWRESPKHYANLLDEVFTHVGIGWTEDHAVGGKYYTLIFGQEFPKSPSAPIRTNIDPSPVEGADEIDYVEYYEE